MVKNPPVNAGDAREVSSSPGLVRSPAEGNGNPLQYSSLENSIQCMSHKEPDTTELLSTHKVPINKTLLEDFPGGLMVKNLPSNAGDVGSIPGQGTKIPHDTKQLSLCTTMKT